MLQILYRSLFLWSSHLTASSDSHCIQWKRRVSNGSHCVIEILYPHFEPKEGDILTCTLHSGSQARELTEFRVTQLRFKETDLLLTMKLNAYTVVRKKVCGENLCYDNGIHNHWIPLGYLCTVNSMQIPVRPGQQLQT